MVGSAGAAFRPVGTVFSRTVRSSGIQSIGSPSTLLSRTPSMRLTFPVTGSPTHNSIPSEREFVKAKWFPSGDQRRLPALAWGGRATGVLEASASLLRQEDV